MMSNTELARKLFRAFEEGDTDTVRAFCRPDLQAIQNFGEPMTLDGLLAMSAAVSAVVNDFRYEEILTTATETGFVEEHLVCGTLPDGSELKLPACVVAVIDDGKITNLREYLDTAAAGALLEAL